MNLTMKELPPALRPYEKCLRYGAETLSNAELLAVFLRTGTKNKNVLDLSEELLERADRNLATLFTMKCRDFMAVPGIGHVKALELECLMAFSKRIQKCSRPEKQEFISPRQIADYFMEEMRLLPEEELMTAFLDGKNALIHEEVLSKGSVNATMIPVREIFKKAYQYNAVKLVLLHNHPSGNPQPSEDDLKATRHIEEAGKILGIPLLDHLIIGDHQYMSFRDRGLIT